MTERIIAPSRDGTNEAERQWKWVPGFEGDYEVSDDGNVRSRKTGHCRLMKRKYNKTTGYEYVILFRNGASKTISVHRLVAMAFIPNPKQLPFINHKDECKRNNHVENLEWCDAAYNTSYSSHKRFKEIEMLSIDGELLATFPSLKHAVSVTGLSKASISQALHKKRMTAGGFNFIFKGGES